MIPVKYENIPSYGAFSEQWKHDEYTKRKNWMKKHGGKLLMAVAACAVIVTVALFLFVR